MEKINIKKLAEMCELPPQEHIIVVDDIKSAVNPSTHSQVMLEGYIYAIVLQGEAHIIVDEVEYTLVRGDMFGCNPRNILERSMMSMDLKVLGMFVTPDYTTKLLTRIKFDWSFLMLAHTHEIIHADEDELTQFVLYLELLRKRLACKATRQTGECVELLIQSMAYMMFDIRQRQNLDTRETDHSPGENLIQRFVLMLTESNQKGTPYLNVNGYAERLNVTPKYFSLVCKNILGKTAKEVIHESILNSAETLLQDNSLSIKQISHRLGFANQSHFGTFIRRYCAGKSPQDLRKNKE